MTLRVPEAGEVHLWVVRQAAAESAALLHEYRALLSSEESAKAARFRFDRHRYQYIITRALLRTVLSGYCDVDPRAWSFGANAYGRPHIAAPDRLCSLSFNIAHSGDLIVCACATSRCVGVDVERVHEAPLDIADRYFSPAEIVELRALPPAAQSERFFQYWTLKESYIKALGTGLSTPLDRFSFLLGEPGHITLTCSEELGDSPGRWQSWLLEPVPGYLLALTIERPTQKITVRNVVPLRSSEFLECAVLASSH